MKDLNKKKDTELTKMLGERRESLRKIRFEKIAGAMKNPSEIRKTKKEVAQILTEINSRKS